MEERILNNVELSLLSPKAKLNQFKELVKTAEEYSMAGICVPAFYSDQLKGMTNIPIVSMISYPYGYSTLDSKLFELNKLKSNEFDVVINNNYIKSNKWISIESELQKIRNAAENKIVKVVINPTYLSKTEMVHLAELTDKYKIDYISLLLDSKFGEYVPIFSDFDIKLKIQTSCLDYDDIQYLKSHGVSRVGVTDISDLLEDVKIYKREAKGK